MFMAPLLKSIDQMEGTREIMWVLVGMSVLFGSSREEKLPVVDWLMNMARCDHESQDVVALGPDERNKR
jgi:hypothetical protein